MDSVIDFLKENAAVIAAAGAIASVITAIFSVLINISIRRLQAREFRYRKDTIDVSVATINEEMDGYRDRHIILKIKNTGTEPEDVGSWHGYFCHPRWKFLLGKCRSYATPFEHLRVGYTLKAQDSDSQEIPVDDVLKKSKGAKYFYVGVTPSKRKGFIFARVCLDKLRI